MKSIYKYLILIYIILVFSKILLSFLISSPTAFADEFYYMKMARSFFYYQNLDVYQGIPSSLFPPLYPIVISIAYLFKNMQLIYPVIKIINAFLSSLIIFPAFLLCKEFLENKKALLCTILIGISPPLFSISPYVMSENLFYPLFLFLVYFMYKSFTNNNLRYDFLMGLLLGLYFLTKVLSPFLAVLIIGFYIYYFIQKRFELKIILKKVLVFLIPFISSMFLWFIRNYSLGFIKINRWFDIFISVITNFSKNYGYSISSSESILTTFSWKSFFYWIPMYVTYIILALGVIFFLSSILSRGGYKKNEKTFFNMSVWILGVFVFIVSIYSASYSGGVSWFVGRPIERYIAMVFPLIIILGFVGITKYSTKFYNKKRFIWVSIILSIIFVVSSQITLTSLFPVNNISLSYIGVLSVFLNKFIPKYSLIIITILFGLIPFFIFKLYKLDIKKIFYLLFTFFILVNLLSYSITAYNSKYRWDTLEQTELGKWFGENIGNDAKVLFDKRDEVEDFRYNQSIFEKRERSVLVMGYWMNNDIYAANVSEINKIKPDYVISTYKLNYPVIKQTIKRERAIYIYKIK